MACAPQRQRTHVTFCCCIGLVQRRRIKRAKKHGPGSSISGADSSDDDSDDGGSDMGDDDGSGSDSSGSEEVRTIVLSDNVLVCFTR